MQNHTRSVLWACSQRALFVWFYTAPAVQRESPSFRAGMACGLRFTRFLSIKRMDETCLSSFYFVLLPRQKWKKRWNLKKWNLWEVVFLHFSSPPTPANNSRNAFYNDCIACTNKRHHIFKGGPVCIFPLALSMNNFSAFCSFIIFNWRASLCSIVEHRI